MSKPSKETIDKLFDAMEIVKKPAEAHSIIKGWHNGQYFEIPAKNEWMFEMEELKEMLTDKQQEIDALKMSCETLKKALERCRGLTYSWVIAEQTVDCKHTYEEIAKTVVDALKDYEAAK